MQGMVTVNISSKDKDQIAQFNSGAIVEINLDGVETSYWANGKKHDVARTTAIKNMVPGDDRRESINSVINLKTQLRQISPMELQST